MLALRQGAPALLLVASSCGPSTAEADYRSSSGNSKLEAIVESAREGDEADLTRLVEQLDSDDPVVRMAAATTLEQLTGKTFGYRHFDSEEERRAAIRLWAEALLVPDADGKGTIEGASEDG